MKLPLANIHFHDCATGWIHFTLDVGGQSTGIEASNLYDPFVNMIRWLQRIVTGHRRCSFTINMEGIEAEFIAADKGHGRLFLLIRSPSNVIPPAIRAVVDRRQFVDSIYTGFTQFAKSELYVEEQWARFSLGDRLARRLPSLGAKQLLAGLARLDRGKLCKLFFDVAPSYQINFEGARTAEEKIGRFIDSVFHPDSKEALAGRIETPDDWELPDDFDAWSAKRRENYLRELLQEPANSWDGYKLDELSSSIIEKYLGWRNDKATPESRHG